MINNYPQRSRLARQENKRLLRQTAIIVGVSILFLVLFLWLGIPGLMKLAISLGNSKSSSKFAQEQDKTPPFAPQFNPVPEATASAIISLDGFSEPGSTVWLYLDGNKITETNADQNGSFLFANIELKSGKNEFTATAKDPSSNQSPLSAPQQTFLKTDLPTLVLSNPTDGQKFFGSLQQIIDVKGSTEPNNQVILNDRMLVVTADGSFNTKFALSENENILKFIVKDIAANQIEKEIRVTYSP